MYARALIEVAVGLWTILAVRNTAYRPARSWVPSLLGLYVLMSLVASLLGVIPQHSLWSDYGRMQGWSTWPTGLPSPGC